MCGLVNKVAIVTGVSSPKGLGKAIAVKLAEMGASLVLTGRTSSRDEVMKNVKDIEAMGVKAIGVMADISNEQEVNKAVGEVVEKFGRIDILVNNAGIGRGSGVFLENQAKDWDINFAVNVKGAMNMCAAVIPEMEKNGGGSIVNISSTAGIGVSSGMPYPYVASKHALVGASKALALEYAKKKIRVNIVAPGAIETDMLIEAYKAIAEAEGISVEEAARLENSTIPTGRPAKPSEIASVVSFLASPEAAYVTGVNVPVHGGLSPGI